MSTLPYFIEARDRAGLPLGGLSPSWTYLESPDKKPVTPQPPITQVEPGLYVTMIDPAEVGDVIGRVDLGPFADVRYQNIAVYRSDSGGSGPSPPVPPATISLDDETIGKLAEALSARIPPYQLPIALPQTIVDQVAAGVAAILPGPQPTPPIEIPRAELDAIAATVTAQVAEALSNISITFGTRGKSK